MILRATFSLVNTEEDIEYDDDVWANLTEGDKLEAARQAALDNLEFDFEEVSE